MQILLLQEMLAQVQMQPTKPDEFWPVSVTGWVTLASSTLALGVVLWRANNKPILDVLTRLEHKVDDEIKRIEVRLDEAEVDRKDGERKILNQIDGRLDGFGKRVEENKESIVFLSAQHVSLAERLVRSEEDRKQINTRLSETRMATDSLSKALPDLELRLNTALHAQTTTLLRELPKMIQEAITSHIGSHPNRRS